jgi:uncharacterized protein DUF2800
MKALVTGSSLGHAEKCAAAPVLPRVRHDIPQAAFGAAGHEHLQLRAELGVDEAMRLLPDTCARWKLTEQQTGALTAMCRRFEWVPPRGALAEIPLCLMADGSVRRLSEGGRGEYELPEGGLFAMTVDMLWGEPSPLPRTSPPRCNPSSTLWVVDVKFGQDVYVSPIAQNAQVLAGAVLAAKWTGAERVTPAVVFARPGAGDWDVLDHWLGPEQIADLHTQLVATLSKVAEQKRKQEAGEWLDYTEGAHCEFCPAQAHCPAKTALLQRYLGSPLQPPGELGALAPQQAASLAAWLPQAERFLHQLRAALKAHVQAHDGAPLDLGDGLLWGPHAVSKTAIDARKALPVVTAQLGAEAAMAAFSVSRSSLEAALRSVPSDEPMATRMRLLMGKLGGAEALGKKQEIWWSAYRADAPAEGESEP